jgi:hypothetical protein
MFGDRTTMPRTMPSYSATARPATSFPVVTIMTMFSHEKYLV